jgi:serine phosphatase RsbU (regulator of sigma subunit)
MQCAFSWITCQARASACHAGGDIACAVDAPGAVVLLIGDVMGHGAPAARTAVEVTGAFRALAAGPDPLQEIAARLHAFVAGRDCGEEFVTALIVRVPVDDGAAPQVVSCGHPQPMRLRAGRATLLDGFQPSPPLGLLDLAGAEPRAEPLPARPGDTLLLYTDGVTDARDRSGRPYPLAERAVALSRDGGPLLRALRADLLRHTEGNFRDDATLLHLRLAPAYSRRTTRPGATRAAAAARDPAARPTDSPLVWN